MDRLKFDDFASDFDDLVIDVDELSDQSQGPDGASLDKIARSLEDARDVADDTGEFDL